MRIEDFDYNLPESAIAQHPEERRDASRLLVLSRATGEIEHRRFNQLPELLSAGDALVLNNSRVIPARLVGSKRDGGARIELLLLEDLGENSWLVLANRARRLRAGTVVDMAPNVSATIEEPLLEGQFVVRFDYEGDWNAVLARLGHMPLPPYIDREDEAEDLERYQTVYSSVTGSAAAPTAGLHFTGELLEGLRERGLTSVEVTLHVGLDTFRPVLEDHLEKHTIHSESYQISEAAAAQLNEVRARGGKIVCVGTTSTRVLETCVDEAGVFHAGEGRTRLYILPGHEFRGVDTLITNFHLPRSTLLALVCAFAGRERVLDAYQTALREGYRFYSYGDAMLIS